MSPPAPRLDEECSGAGGTHVTLDVVRSGRGDTVTVVPHGEHACWPPPEGDEIEARVVEGERASVAAQEAETGYVGRRGCLRR